MDPENLKTLSDRIEYVCFKKRLKQSELAQILGVSSTAIYKIVSGATANPSMELLLGFYQKLDVNLLWLASGEGEMDAKPQKKVLKDESFGEMVVQQMESRIEELKEQVGNLKYVVNLQQQLLERSGSVAVGKLEGAIIDRPLSNMGFEALFQQYVATVKGHLDRVPFFFEPQSAKLVAPRSI